MSQGTPESSLLDELVPVGLPVPIQPIEPVQVDNEGKIAGFSEEDANMFQKVQ